MEIKQTYRLWTMLEDLRASCCFVDLTHSFHPGQPRFPALPDEERKVIFDFEQGHGFQIHQYNHVGQWGTHVDPPVHFIKGGQTLDQIAVDEMVLPLVVLDITEKVKNSADATPSMQDVESWERRHGLIPKGAFVALRTDWSNHWPDVAAMANHDANGVSHTPGWSKEVLAFLFETRQITAIGHEQTDTDPGLATSRGDYSLEYYVLSLGRWQIELMTNLSKVPQAGALVVASWPKPLAGSGYPARVFAIFS